jgi:hypothetical protein
MHQIIRSGDRSLKSRHFVPQYRYFYDGKGNRFVNQVIKFDNLQEEFNQLMAQYDIPLVLDNHDNFSEKTLSVGDLDEDTKILIQRVYKRDFLEFGFDQ